MRGTSPQRRHTLDQLCGFDGFRGVLEDVLRPIQPLRPLPYEAPLILSAAAPSLSAAKINPNPVWMDLPVPVLLLF